MPSQPIGRNAKCPCGSGKKYKQCCLKKDSEFREDEDGMIPRIIPMSDELGDALADRIDQMSVELGRDPQPDDALFPNHLEHTEHQMVEAMKAAGVDPALIYAFEETGLIVSEENQDIISGKDFAEWESAVGRYRSRHGQSAFEYPIGTVAIYGPDDKLTTKIVASVIRSADSEPILERFVGTGITEDPAVQDKISTFFADHGVTQVAATDQNMGCPHEEGEDFPEGEDCPFCPFWKGKQGSAAMLDNDEPTAEQAGMLMQMLQNMAPDAASELVNLVQQCDSEDEFVNMIMVGPCPHCDSVDTEDCEDDPEIDDPTIGRCSNCGQLWCCDCEETFDNAALAAAHDCPFWESLEDGDDEIDDEPF